MSHFQRVRLFIYSSTQLTLSQRARLSNATPRLLDLHVPSIAVHLSRLGGALNRRLGNESELLGNRTPQLPAPFGRDMRQLPRAVFEDGGWPRAEPGFDNDVQSLRDGFD